jgi:hypothetical protein
VYQYGLSGTRLSSRNSELRLPSGREVRLGRVLSKIKLLGWIRDKRTIDYLLIQDYISRDFFVAAIHFMAKVQKGFKMGQVVKVGRNSMATFAKSAL